MRFRLLARVALVTLMLTANGSARSDRDDADSFTNWPEGADPRVLGTRLTERFIASPHQIESNEIRYPEVVAWYGALGFAKESRQEKLTRALIKRAKPLLRDEAHLVPPPDHVDRNVFGALAAELYLQGAGEPFKRMARSFADTQWEPTEEVIRKGSNEEVKQRGLSWRFDRKAREYVEQGLSWQTRFWIDDMYMITMAQGQMFRVSGNRDYIDRAAREMVVYLDKLQKPNGLFYHAPEVPFFWGRGNGWMAAGMTELLRVLPKDHPDRPRIGEGYRKMMVTLRNHQTEDGMWRQLVDDPASWPESSGTGMFVFALVTGVKEGWLKPRDFGPVARRGWIALAGHIREDGAVREVCVGTNKKNSRDFYLRRPRVSGDLHGQAAALWSATALIREPVANLQHRRSATVR